MDLRVRELEGQYKQILFNRDAEIQKVQEDYDSIQEKLRQTKMESEVKAQELQQANRILKQKLSKKQQLMEE